MLCSEPFCFPATGCHATVLRATACGGAFSHHTFLLQTQLTVMWRTVPWRGRFVASNQIASNLLSHIDQFLPKMFQGLGQGSEDKYQ
jgi:hypothetical protein